jgi:hypothetical protein
VRRRKPLLGCRIRHSFSRWAYVKVDCADGFEPEIHEGIQFRMCRNCGHQEIRERVDA